ncbi:hypothetical protein IQ230_23510 [Gloeocapsopsis crepidinum LEGE 06123]|uniref:Uncharacterized protein n=1 Tax=Gloeocapsopsis crepidinum LEGE 06123 TaxID=588587 RepID=A0ABR9UZ32_9CHRO|nr:hypothetical protein [Gloeocapsopsis crepidinum]MBE9193258.1 hypothetical protein [Gloeocapsopsis crepidinum LEGE 06123]
MKINIAYSQQGKPQFIHYNRGTQESPMWASLPFNSDTKEFEPQSPMDFTLMSEVEALEEWQTLDLSDRPAATDASTPLEPNYSGLTTAVRETPVFGKAYIASKTNADILSALAFFMAALNTNAFTMQDLMFALNDLHRAMGTIWTEDDINYINSSLRNNNFNFQI